MNDLNVTRFPLSDTLFTTIRSSVETDPGGERRIILYTSYGVVSGRVSAATFSAANRAKDPRLENSSRVTIDPDVLELEHVTVEHYSNHLPSGTFERLFVRLNDVRSFAMMD
jgi:hypothetical protein